MPDNVFIINVLLNLNAACLLQKLGSIIKGNLFNTLIKFHQGKGIFCCLFLTMHQHSLGHMAPIRKDDFGYPRMFRISKEHLGSKPSICWSKETHRLSIIQNHLVASYNHTGITGAATLMPQPFKATPKA